MNFWDSSAVVPLLVEEAGTEAAQAVLRADSRVAVWWATPVECLAAIAQGERASEYGSAEADQARARLAVLRGDWNEILPTEEVRERAAALVRRYPLRTGDSLQLAAALTWARGRPSGRRLLTLDTRLSDAARWEGFESSPAPGRP